MTFTDSELDTIAHCLSVAAECFKQDAMRMEDNKRLAEQFEYQAKKARELQDRIDGRE